MLYFLCVYALLEALKYFLGVFISVHSPDMLQENIGRTIVIFMILDIYKKRLFKGKAQLCLLSLSVLMLQLKAPKEILISSLYL